MLLLLGYYQANINERANYTHKEREIFLLLSYYQTNTKKRANDAHDERGRCHYCFPCVRVQKSQSKWSDETQNTAIKCDLNG